MMDVCWVTHRPIPHHEVRTLLASMHNVKESLYGLSDSVSSQPSNPMTAGLQIGSLVALQVRPIAGAL